MIQYFTDLEQGTDEWLQVRCGLLTASEMKLIVTPTLKTASNDKERGHLYELVAQRITKYVEPSYIGDNMLRGMRDEVEARIIYSEKIAPVSECGFITNDKLGYTIGYSSDGLVGDDGLIECKSKRQKLHTEVILSQSVPSEHIIQIQTGLLISERKWCDFISYCGGMPLYIHRVYPDLVIQDAIITASKLFECRAAELIESYYKKIEGLIPTERIIEQEITI